MFVISTLGVAWLFAASRRSAWACRTIACLLIPTALIVAACGTSTPLSTPTDEEAKANDVHAGNDDTSLVKREAIERSPSTSSNVQFETVAGGVQGVEWRIESVFGCSGCFSSSGGFAPNSRIQQYSFNQPGVYRVRAWRKRSATSLILDTIWQAHIGPPAVTAPGLSPQQPIPVTSTEYRNVTLTASIPGYDAATTFRDPFANSQWSVDLPPGWTNENAGFVDSSTGGSVTLRLKSPPGDYSDHDLRVRCNDPELGEGMLGLLLDLPAEAPLEAKFVVREWDADTDDANDPVLGESGSTIDAELGLKVTFDSSTSTGNIYRRYWYFSDGTTSTAATVDKTLSTSGDLKATLLLYAPGYATSGSSDMTIKVQGMQVDPDYRMPGLGFYPHAYDIDDSTLWSVSNYGLIWRVSLTSNPPVFGQMAMTAPVSFPISSMSACRSRIFFPKGQGGVEVYSMASNDSCTLVSPSPIVLESPGVSRAIGVAATPAASSDATESLVFVATQLPEQLRIYSCRTSTQGATTAIHLKSYEVPGIRGLVRCGEDSDRRAVVAYTSAGKYYCFDPSQPLPVSLPAGFNSGIQLSAFNRSLGNTVAIAGYGTTLMLTFSLPQQGQVSPPVQRLIPISSSYFAFTPDRLYVRDDFKVYKYNISAGGADFMEAVGAPDQVVKPMFTWQVPGEAKPRLYLGTGGDSYRNGFVRLRP